MKEMLGEGVSLSKNCSYKEIKARKKAHACENSRKHVHICVYARVLRQRQYALINDFYVRPQHWGL